MNIFMKIKNSPGTFFSFREFVYLLGGVAHEGKASIPDDLIANISVQDTKYYTFLALSLFSILFNLLVR
jgi:hypothetical protein